MKLQIDCRNPALSVLAGTLVLHGLSQKSVQAFTPLSISTSGINTHLKPHRISSHVLFSTKTTTTSSSTSNDVSPKTKIIKQDILAQLNTCKSGTTARQILIEALVAPNVNSDNPNINSALFNSLKIPPLASSKFLSDAELAIQTQIRNQKRNVLELIETNGDADADRASLFLLGLMIASPITSIQIQQLSNSVIFLPDILRFVLVWLFAFFPLIFVGAGLAIPQTLQGQLMTLQGLFFPSYNKRMIQHEAGHLLMGHLLGLPVQNYQVNTNAIRKAVEFYPLADENVGRSRAQTLGFDKLKSSDSNNEYNNDNNYVPSDRPFFSEGGKADQLLQRSVFADAPSEDKYEKYKIKKSLVTPENDPTSVWPYRKLDDATMDILAVVSMAGVVSEILTFGNAQGGNADIAQLTAFLKSNGCTDDEIENKIRYAIGYNFSQLRRHLGVLDEVADVMEQGGSVSECVLVMESCEEVAGKSTVMQKYEDLRKEKFEQEWNILEKVLLGRRNINGDRTDVIEGKGGGDIKEKFALTGDDPLYAAGALALIFFVWAASGGLTLH